MDEKSESQGDESFDSSARNTSLSSTPSISSSGSSVARESGEGLDNNPVNSSDDEYKNMMMNCAERIQKT